MDVLVNEAPGEGRRLHPGWPSHALAAFALTLSAWEFSTPGGRLPMLLILLLLWGGLVCYWIVGLPATVLWERRLPDRRSLLHWLVIPAAVAVLAALWYTGASLYARFQLSRPAMDDLAMTVLDAPRQSDFDSKRVGLYWARNIERVGGVVRFQVAGSGFGNNTGFAYSPTQEPPNLGEDTYEHLYGPWWLWEESW